MPRVRPPLALRRTLAPNPGQYDQFWAAPEQVCISWLALLYTMFTYAAWHSLRSGELHAFSDLGAAQRPTMRFASPLPGVSSATTTRFPESTR